LGHGGELGAHDVGIVRTETSKGCEGQSIGLRLES